MRYSALTIEALKAVKDQIEVEECLCLADGTCPNCGVVSQYYVLLMKDEHRKEIDRIMACKIKKKEVKKTRKK